MFGNEVAPSTKTTINTTDSRARASDAGNLCTVLGRVMDRPGKVDNRARGQLNRENEYFPVPVRA